MGHYSFPVFYLPVLELNMQGRPRKSYAISQRKLDVGFVKKKPKQKAIRRCHPTSNDLLAWFLYEKLLKYQESKENMPPPPLMFKWLSEFRQKYASYWHRQLYDNYAEFRETFYAPS